MPNELLQSKERFKNSGIYAVTPGPIAGKMGLFDTLKRCNVCIDSNQLKLLENLADALSGQLIDSINPLLARDGEPILALNPPIGERREKTTQRLISLLSTCPEIGALILEPFHFDWSRRNNLPIAPLQLNRLWTPDNQFLGIGSRPISGDPRGFVPLREQLQVILTQFEKQNPNIRSLVLVEDIIDSGITIRDLVEIIRGSFCFDVLSIILTGSIYPEKKEKIETEILRGIPIEAIGNIADSNRKIVGGFNLVDCIVGGLGSTLGTWSESWGEFVPLIIGQRTDGTPLPGGIIYGSVLTWGNFLKRSPLTKQPQILEAVLDVNQQFWKRIEELTGKRIRLGDLQRFPYGIGIDPDKYDPNIPLLTFINKALGKLSQERASIMLSPEQLKIRLRRVKSLVLDLDGVLIGEDEIMPQGVKRLLKELRQLGIDIWINTLRTQTTFTKIDEENDNWFTANVSGMIYEDGACAVVNGQLTTFTSNPEEITKVVRQIDKYLQPVGHRPMERGISSIKKTVNKPNSVMYYFVTVDGEPADYETCKRIARFLSEDIKPSDSVVIRPTGSGSIIVTDPHCDKGSALRVLNIDPQTTITIGNSLCDEPMLDFATQGGGIGVSVSESSKKANWKTQSSNWFGTYEILQKLLSAKQL